MQYSDLSQYFQNEETLIQLLVDCQDYFDTIDGYNEQIFKNEINETTIPEFRKGKREVSGAKGNLEVIYKFAQTFKRNEELKKYMAIKQATPKGAKFVSAAVDKEAEASVHLPRKVRNVIEGYIKKADVVLSALNDMRYDAEADWKKEPHE